MGNKSKNYDWHSQLMDCLATALTHTQSVELKLAMHDLSQQLTKIDECAHTITVTAELPLNVSVEDLREALNFEIDVPKSVELIGDSQKVKVITHFRSGKAYAEATAVSNLQDAVKYCVSDPAIEWPVQIKLES